MNPHTPRYFDQIYTISPEDYLPLESVQQAALLTAPGKALDIGTGLGRHALLLAQMGYQVTAVDFSRIAIWKLRDRARAMGVVIDARKEDILETGFRDHYDLIVCVHTLQHFPSPRIEPFIQSMQEHTLVGGVNFILAFTEKGDLKRISPEAFYLKEGQLRELYSKWNILEYREQATSVNVGHGVAKSNHVAHMIARRLM
jgi:tellurite methyltransferase